MAMVCAFGILIGMQFNQSLVDDGYVRKSDIPAHLAIYEASEHIKTKFYGDLNESVYTDAVLREMIDQLDPYSHYFGKKGSQRYDRYMDGLFRGIGLEFIQYRDSTYVYKVIPASPADQAGIKRGDIVISLDSIDLTNSMMPLDSLLRHKINDLGDEVRIDIYSWSDAVIRSHNLNVEDVELPLIEDYIIQNGPESYISLVKIKRFYSNVFRDFMQVLERHGQMNGSVQSLIIDLRNNPGGIVEETIKILNQFIPEKERLILSTKSRIQKTKEYHSNGRNFLDVERIVILCNEYSASASEILAGVLQDYDKAVIIGQNTYGKGLIQQNYDLSNQGSINLSIGEYILPSGRHIYGQNNTDSIYKSLVNARNLFAEKGIPVDIEISECPLQRTLEQKTKDLVVRDRLWEKEQILNIDAAIAKLVYELNVEEDCIKQITANVKWSIIGNSIKNGDMIEKDDTDEYITEAIRVIRSDLYNEFLGYN